MRLRNRSDPQQAIDDLATLALIVLAKNETPQALIYAQKIQVALETCGGVGPEFPQRAYWACFCVFDAVGQTTEAQAALQAAYAWVMARAARITDPELRHSFLRHAPRNRQVLEDARQVLGLGDEGQH